MNPDRIGRATRRGQREINDEIGDGGAERAQSIALDGIAHA
jgi:hypothetical protein